MTEEKIPVPALYFANERMVAQRRGVLIPIEELTRLQRLPAHI
jgi:hypothetical protein